MNCYKNLALFAGGILLVLRGVKLLASKRCEKGLYTCRGRCAEDEGFRDANRDLCSGKRR